jgi:hypothetical protein
MSYSQEIKNLPADDFRINGGLRFNITNVISLLVLIGPLFVMGMLLVLSLFNSSLKGIVYLVGVSILYIVVLLLQKSIGTLFISPTKTQYNSGFCNLFSNSYIYTSNPSFNSALYAFTFFYLLFPMITNGMLNIGLIIFFIMIYVLDIVVRTQVVNCVSISNVAMGTLIGAVISFLYYSILQSSPDTKKFIYYNDFDSNRVACSRPTKNKFKCSVYKNGELIS